MSLLAVVIGDYCSEIMPWWYCVLFQSPTSIAFPLFCAALVAITLYGLAERRA